MNTPNVFLHEATALARALAMTTALLVSSLGLAAPAHGAAPASPATARLAAADVAGTTCINFEDLIVGMIYPIHSGFTSNGTSITVKPLDYFTADPVAGGQSEVENANRTGGGGKDIGLSDADLNISYTVPISGLSFSENLTAPGSPDRKNAEPATSYGGFCVFTLALKLPFTRNIETSSPIQSMTSIARPWSCCYQAQSFIRTNTGDFLFGCNGDPILIQLEPTHKQPARDSWLGHV